MPDQPDNPVSAIVLAGGEGRRVDDADKGLLVHRDKPLVEHVIATIAPQVDDIVISANRNIARYQDYGYQVVRDSDDTCRGPLAGILACLPYCRHERILVVPCDMPDLPGDLVDRLTTGTCGEIAIAETGSRLQLALVLDRKLAPSIETALQNDELSLMRWVKSRNHDSVPFDDNSRFTNLNDGI